MKKKDGGIRTCVDLRGVNKVTVFDSEPMPDLENIFARMGQAGKRYFSKLANSVDCWVKGKNGIYHTKRVIPIYSHVLWVGNGTSSVLKDDAEIAR